MVVNTERRPEIRCRVESPWCEGCDDDAPGYDMRLVTVEADEGARTLIYQCSGCDGLIVCYLEDGWW
jgi:hypothetical protein